MCIVQSRIILLQTLFQRIFNGLLRERALLTDSECFEQIGVVRTCVALSRQDRSYNAAEKRL